MSPDIFSTLLGAFLIFGFLSMSVLFLLIVIAAFLLLIYFYLRRRKKEEILEKGMKKKGTGNY